MADARRPRTARPRRGHGALLAVALFAVGAGGCERGCLARWLADKGGAAGPSPGLAPPTRGSAPSQDRAGLTLSAVDCPEGMARCGDGVVSVSRAYHYAEPCTGSPEQCQCPWERLGDCARGCAAEGALVDVPRERALGQLCAPIPSAAGAAGAGRPFALAPPPGAIAPSCDAPFLCDHGLVVACGPPARVVGACADGCARDGQSLEPEDDDAVPLTPDAALAVLCKR